MASEAERRIADYLAELRSHLRRLKQVEIREIVDELRGHIIDKVAATGTHGELDLDRVNAALATLGSPEEIASQYVTDSLLARAEASRSPLTILQSLFHWATLSVAGFFLFLGSLIGYFFGIVFVLVAIAKFFHPQSAGLWLIPNGGESELSFRLGFGTVPSGARDLFGWWIVPIGWIGGSGIVILTTNVAVLCARQYLRSRRQHGR
jgi:hypothetical protein